MLLDPEPAHEIFSEEELPYYEQTLKEIRNGDSYVCLICTVELDASCRMYACSACYRVYDYDCVREWALKSTRKTADKSWKCPNCYVMHHKVPSPGMNTCWCGKVLKPESNYLEPNSCGQTCGAKTCIHGCSKICHLGPHPECKLTVTVRCKCGKHTQHLPCYKAQEVGNSFDCKEICGLMLPCEKHRCTKTCHNGFCGNCDQIIEKSLSCYCGSESVTKMKCSDMRVITYSKNQNGKKWIGVYSCNRKRTLNYACGEHTYLEACESPLGIDKTVPCPFSPELVKTCPCGRSDIVDLVQSRRKCTDEIPTCDNKCGKPLSCGKHVCPFTCHTGQCMDPCLTIEQIRCACQSFPFLSPCQFNESHSPRCKMKCESSMSCRKHKCHEVCCSGKPAAKRREKQLFSRRDRNDETLVEPEHICLKSCHSKLSCGIHYCKWKCHSGKCPPCLESDSNDLSCPCGKTVIPAPVRCGTKLPSCRNPCIKISQGNAPCGHKVGPHPCHPMTENCPPCTVGVTKPCRCEKRKDMRTLCLVPDEQVSCGLECGKKLDNCPHSCQKRCHTPGDCETRCVKRCGLKRKSCSHECQSKCHGNSACPESTCSETVFVSCECGRRTELVKCGANHDAPSKQVSMKLLCDEECEVLKRQQALMAALGINDKSVTSDDQVAHTISKASSYEDLHLPYDENCLYVYKKQYRWCNQISDVLNRLLEDKNKPSHHFKPMKAAQRQFVHQLCNAYGLYSESQDREPNRSVFVKKLGSKSRKPALSLQEADVIFIKYRETEAAKQRQNYECSVTKTILNAPVVQSAVKQLYTGPNAMKIDIIDKNTLSDDLREIVNGFLKYTLLKSPQYIVMEDKNILIYPENYLALSENSGNDLKRVIPFLNDALKERLIASDITPCRLDGQLKIVMCDN